MRRSTGRRGPMMESRQYVEVDGYCEETGEDVVLRVTMRFWGGTLATQTDPPDPPQCNVEKWKCRVHGAEVTRQERLPPSLQEQLPYLLETAEEMGVELAMTADYGE